MSKAACPSSKLTRRAAIGVALAGAATPALPASDPALSLITAHKAAYTRLDRACIHMSRMETAIPKELRQEWWDEDRGNGVGANDDPRWTAALDAYRAAADAETEAAWTLARAQPVSLAGAAALLRYAAEYEAQGCDWPCDMDEDSDDDASEDDGWHGVFHRGLAKALDAMATRML